MKEHEKIVLNIIKVYAQQADCFREDMTFDEFSDDLKTVSGKCSLTLYQNF
jgi:hypothetical protein